MVGVASRRLTVTRGPSDRELFARGAETLVASWAEYARWAPGAAVHRLAGVDVAVFPNEPERAVYNNALVARACRARERADALAALERAYADGRRNRFAVWAHEDDDALRSDLERRGYRLDTSTRAMGMALADMPAAAAHRPRAGGLVGAPPDRRAAAELPSPRRSHAPSTFGVGRLGGEDVATALAFDHRGDCGIYNVGTLEHARRRGLGTALTLLQLHDARARGCQTASLQATPRRSGSTPPSDSATSAASSSTARASRTWLTERREREGPSSGPSRSTATPRRASQATAPG